MFAPSECLEHLKCSICCKLLSLFPIYVGKDDDNQQSSICGRCKVPDNKMFIRNESYEVLATNMLFPCINRKYGCIDDLLPEDVAQHESICSYRPSECVVAKQQNCKWEGGFNKLSQHCKIEHKNLFLENNEFKIELNENQDALNILEYQCEMFLFERSFDYTSRDLKYRLTRLQFDKTTTIYYCQIQLKTVDYTCVRFFELNLKGDNSKSLNMNIESMLDANNTLAAGTIQVADSSKQLNLISNIEQLSATMLKCHQCASVVLPPLRQCRYPHLLCSNCNVCRCGNQVGNMPQSINDAMNCIYYRCQYGCKFFGNSADLQKHNNNCLYKPYNCLLNTLGCKWQDLRYNLIEHIFTNHKDKIIKLNENVSMAIDIQAKTQVKLYKFFKFSGNFFKLFVEYKHPYLLWVVEVVNSIEGSSNFKFEITMYNKNNCKRAIIRERCGKLRFIDEYSVNDHYCICLHENQIQGFLVEKILSFGLNIFK